MTGREISALVGLKPWISNDVGERRRSPKGAPGEGTYDRSYCCYELAEGNDAALVKSLSRWNNYFSKRRGKLRRLTRGGGRLEYYLGLHIKSNGGLELPAELLEEAGRSGIRLALDIYGGEAAG